MASSISNPPLLLLTFFVLASTIILKSTQAFSISLPRNEIRERRRSLLSFKEIPNGGNATFQCSPSGPCISCPYSQKSDDKYRCSETGYHIPLKCKEIKGGSKLKNDKKAKKDRSTIENTKAKIMQDGVEHRRLLDNSSKSEAGNQAYVTYRSCIPAVFEEKLSVLGFEAIMLGLLMVSGPFVYFRRKRSVPMAGVGGPPMRVQSNPRF
ncbi:hypothetical protein ACHQM5_005965 [Ranunculus cassubicifolius]